MAADYLTLLDYRQSMLPIVALSKMHGAKRAVTDSFEVWVSDSMYALAVEEKDVCARDWAAAQIEVVRVRSLKHEWQQAAF